MTESESCTDNTNPKAYKFVTGVPASNGLSEYQIPLIRKKMLPGAVYKYTYSAKRVGGYGMGQPSPAVSYTEPCKSR